MYSTFCVLSLLVRIRRVICDPQDAIATYNIWFETYHKKPVSDVECPSCSYHVQCVMCVCELYCVYSVCDIQ